MTFYLATFLLCIPSPVAGGIPYPEAWAVLNGLLTDRPFLLVGLAVGCGQCVCYTALFFLGERVLRFLPVMRRRIDRFDREKLAQRSGPVLIAAGILSLPPVVPLAILAPAVGIRFAPFIGVMIAGRWLRFSILCGVPGVFAEFFPREIVPDWLMALM